MLPTRMRMMSDDDRSREQLIEKLRDLPICASCKKVRDDGGYWIRLEAYLSEHSDLDYETIQVGQGGGMLMVSANGTAVRFTT